MARYRMSDGMVVDTEKATAEWEENTRWDGRNHISLATGTQWDHQQLYRSKRGRYYIVHWSQWSTPTAEWVSNEEACRWLLLMGAELPAELATLADEVSE